MATVRLAVTFLHLSDKAIAALGQHCVGLKIVGTLGMPCSIGANRGQGRDQFRMANGQYKPTLAPRL